MRIYAAIPSLLLIAGSLSAATPTPRHEWLLTSDHVADDGITAVTGGMKAAHHGEKTEVGSDWTVFFGKGSLCVKGLPPAELPTSNITVEAVVRVDASQQWGGILQYCQDNGSYEKGWNLGYLGAQYAFQLSVGPKLVTARSTTAIEKGKWVHLLGTYDSKALRLYVNGTEECKVALSGAIDYPPAAVYSIGSYHDTNEYYGMRGAIRRLRLYDSALSADEADILARQELAQLPQPLRFREPPQLRFISADAADLTWSSDHTGTCVVEYGRSMDDAETVPTESKEMRHVARLADLRPATRYVYRIRYVSGNGSEQVSKAFTFDTTLNYMGVAAAGTGHGNRIEEAAAALLKQTGITRGVCVVAGLVDARFITALVRQSRLNVLGLGSDPARVAAIRQTLYGEGVYGTRATVLCAPEGSSARIPSSFANLLTSERPLHEQAADIDLKRFRELLAPGGTECVLKPDGTAGARYVAPLRPGAGTWTHQYGTAGNTTTSGETLAGARKTSDLHVQWFGRPGGDFGIDRQPRMPAPLAVSGRLFHQGMNRVIGMDAWNGTVLWQAEIPDLRRVNMPRDASNWCADEQRLYLALKNQAWVLNHATGDKQRTLTLPAHPNTHEWGFIANNTTRLFGSAVKRNASYTAYWSGGMWYEKINGSYTAKVCSDVLFALDKQDMSRAWTYERGAIINSTICATEESVTFIESRHPDIVAMKSGRISDGKLWQDQYLVALDAHTGEVRWERPIDTEDGLVVFYMQHSADHIVVTSSYDPAYYIYAFDPTNGQQRWKTSHKWPSRDHSGHMQHPVLYDDAYYVEPFGYNVNDGSRLEKRMGGRSGCHTYMGVANALIYRGSGRRIAMWDRESGAITAWDRLRPSCWLSVIAANGMLLAPEGGAGCSCGHWMETSFAFAPNTSEAEIDDGPKTAPTPTRGPAYETPAPETPIRSDYWPTFRHDNRRSCSTEDTLALPLKRVWAWRSPAPPDPAWTGPAKWDAFSGNDGLQSLRNFDPVHYVTVAEGLVFFGSSSDDGVHCLGASSGKERWVTFAGAPVRLPPTWHNGTLYAGSDDGYVYALSATDGRERWRYSPHPNARRALNNGNVVSFAPCRTGVMVTDGRVCFAASLLPWRPSWLCALDARTGRTDGEGSFVQRLTSVTLQGALLAAADTLIAPQGRSQALAYNMKDGQPLGPIGKSGGVDCLVTDDGTFVSGPQNQKGKDNVVLFSDTTTRKNTRSVLGATRLVANDTHTFFHNGRDLVCMDRANPQQVDALWKTDSPAPLGYALTPEHLVTGHDGLVTVRDIRNGRSLATLPVEGKAYGLAIAHQRLIVSTDRGDIVCFRP